MAAKNYITSSSVELPYFEDGSVDWNTLGNIVTGHMLAEVVHAGYVDRKHGTVSVSKSFKAETDWEFAYEEDNIVVLKRKGERTFWLGRGVIDVPVQTVAERIKDVRSAHIWDKLLVETKYLKVLTQTDTCTDYIGYMRWETTKCFFTAKKDMLYFVRCAFMDGKYIHSAISVDDPEYPVPSGVTRMDARSGCGFVLEPYKGDKNQTLFNYLGNIDMKGVPKFILSKVLKVHPVCTIQALRKYFADLRQRQMWATSAEATSSIQINTETQPGDSMLYHEQLPIEDYLTEGNSS